MGYSRTASTARSQQRPAYQPEVIDDWSDDQEKEAQSKQYWEQVVSGEASRIAQRQVSILEKEAQKQLDNYALAYEERDAKIERRHRRQVRGLKVMLWLMTLSLFSLAGAAGYGYVKQVKPRLDAYRAFQGGAAGAQLSARMADQDAQLTQLRAENEAAKADALQLRSEVKAMHFALATVRDVLGGAPATLKASALNALTASPPPAPAAAAPQAVKPVEPAPSTPKPNAEPAKAPDATTSSADAAKAAKHATPVRPPPPVQAKPTAPVAAPVAAPPPPPRPAKACKCQPGDPMCACM